MAKILLREGPDPLPNKYQIFSKVPYQDQNIYAISGCYNLFDLASMGDLIISGYFMEDKL